jgi:hypothetical protein
VAEEIANIEPLLAIYNEKGEIEGVKYKQLTTVLVNAVREQMSMIERQRREIDLMKQTICDLKPDAAICRDKEEPK